MSKALESKHDKILKSLLRQPDNKRCINCETLGPQYAVADFQIFVCTICSGVHRQFSHRVKGLSTSTFKPEEIKALESGGNRVGAYTYLAKWSPSDLQKPVDRNTGKIKDWIDAVYIKKRFYSAEAAASAMHSPPPPVSNLPRRSISSNASSAGDDVPVMSMAGLLGDVKLKVDPNHLVSNAPNGLNLRATSTASSHSHDSPAPNHVSNQLFNILDEPLAETAAGAPLQAAPPSAGWDAFAAPAPSPAPTAGPSASDSMAWSAFDNGGPAAPAPVLTNNHQLPPQTQQRPQQQQQPQQQQPQQQQPDMAWAAFDGPSNPPVPQQQAQQQFQGAQQSQGAQQFQGAQQGQQQGQQQGVRGPEPVAAPQPPKPAPRQELPLDLFGDGLLSSYNAPPSITNMYGQQGGRPPMPYGQQHNSFQQPGLHQQPNSFQQPGPYQQAPPNRPPGLPHGMSFGGYGQQAGPPPVHGLNAFDGLGRQRSHSDANGAGAVSSPDPFTGLVPGLAGALPSMPVSRQTSISSTHSAQDLPSHQAWSANPAVSQSFGQHAPQQPGQTASMAFSDPFAGSSYGAQPAQGQLAAPASRAPPKSSGNPFA